MSQTNQTSGIELQSPSTLFDPPVSFNPYAFLRLEGDGVDSIFVSLKLEGKYLVEGVTRTLPGSIPGDPAFNNMVVYVKDDGTSAPGSELMAYCDLKDQERGKKKGINVYVYEESTDTVKGRNTVIYEDGDAT